MIEIDHLSVRSEAFRLEGVSLGLAGGEYGVLMGPSGAGKTTLLEAVCGLRPIAGGVIRLAGRDVTGWPPADRRVGYAPQDGALFTTMRVRDNLAYGLRVRRLGRERTATRVDEVAELLGLQSLLDRRPTGLSGGEMRRVAIGRAIAFAPAVLLLDEPLAGLDTASRDEVRGALQRVRQATRTTTLHVSHDAEDARQLADRVFWLEAGQLAETMIDSASLERLPLEGADARGPLKPKPNAPTSA